VSTINQLSDSAALAPVPEQAPAPTGPRALWRALRRDRAAMAGFVVVALLVLLAVGAPLWTAIEGQNPYAYHDDLLNSAVGGAPLGSFGGVSGAHWLGVEPQTGRDLFARIAYGAQVSLAVSIGATLLQVLLGVGIGLAAGLGGRFADALLSRIIDLAIAFPYLIFGIALLAIVPASFPRPVLLVVVMAVLGWGGTARISRAQTLSLRTRDYVAAARLGGSGTARIARREILPGLAAPVITYAALLLPANMVLEAGFSFLGIGVRPPTSSWGQILSSATTWYYADPTYVALPCAVLFASVFGFVLLGEGVRKSLDPRASDGRG
jgi:peptide/nickel transport system permease protein